jgi:predicted dehydrogenase
MTKQISEALAVVDTWRSTGKIMQVGVQSTSLKVWDQARQLIDEGKLGKVLGFQTEYFRNSNVGQWRYYKLDKEMSPKTVDWKRWLGVEEGLAPMMDFDRAVYAQWRCYWPFGSGMFTDLFVHRTTSMLKATGLRFPGRVVGGGGIYLEYDGRDVPDVATVVADYNEGCQAIITATMCNENSRIKQVIRGHFGAFEFGNGEQFTDFKFLAERKQVTLNSKIEDETIVANDGASVGKGDTTYLHFKNWLAAVADNNQQLCNNPPDLGAAAITTVNLGAQSYRDGKVFFFDKETGKVREGDGTWSAKWEAMSKARSKPNHVPGWAAGDTGSLLQAPDYMSLAGPWKNGKPPEEQKG